MRHQDDETVEPANDPVNALVHLNSASLDFWNVRSLRLPRAQSSNHTNDLENQFCVFSPWNSRWPRHRTPPTVDSNWAVFPRKGICPCGRSNLTVDQFAPHRRGLRLRQTTWPDQNPFRTLSLSLVRTLGATSVANERACRNA